MKLYEDLVNILDDQKVSILPKDIEEHAKDKWYAKSSPDVVVFAKSTNDVEKVLKYANKYNIPVYTRGAGVGYVGGCVPVQGGIALSVFKMDKILEVSPQDGVVLTEPGVITGNLQDAVKQVGWYYPPDPASLKECSIGGNVATNAGGPRCLKYGVTKQYVMGLTVVLASGEVVKLGGRCHKNKTGFDIASLFIGSEGMLGVVTEIILRIIPHPETRAMLGASFTDFSSAAKCVQDVFNSGRLPSALEITDTFTLNAARDYLGNDKLPEGDAYLMIEIDGRKHSVETELLDLQKFLIKSGALSINVANNEEECEKIWQLRRDFSYSLRHTGMTKLNEDVVVPRSKLVDLVDFAEKLQQESNIDIACFGHAGDGNIHTNIMVADYHNSEVKKNADRVVAKLFNWIIENDGAITGEHGVGLAKKAWIKDALGTSAFNLHLKIKSTIDPNNILNPGKFLD